MSYIITALMMLLNVVFITYILLVMLRFILQWVRADFRNPIARFLIATTNPPLKPMRRFIPGWGGIDLSSVILMLILQFAALWLGHLLLGENVSLQSIIVRSVGELLQLAYYVYLFAILIQVIFSWLNPGNYNPVIELFADMTRPLLYPIRRRLPQIGGLDLSPLILLLVLQLLLILVVTPIIDFSVSMR